MGTTIAPTSVIEGRLAQQEQRLAYMIGQQQNQSLSDKMALEKQISIRQIVDDEKKLVQERYEREIQELKARHDVHGPNYLTRDQLARLFDEHATILDAIESRNGDVARDSMRRHI